MLSTPAPACCVHMQHIQHPRSLLLHMRITYATGMSRSRATSSLSRGAAAFTRSTTTGSSPRHGTLWSHVSGISDRPHATFRKPSQRLTAWLAAPRTTRVSMAAQCAGSIVSCLPFAATKPGGAALYALKALAPVVRRLGPKANPGNLPPPAGLGMWAFYTGHHLLPHTAPGLWVTCQC